MLFTEPRFVLFFAVVFAAHWALRGRRARVALLLVASYAFHAAFDARFLVLLGFQTAAAYVCALGLERVGAGARRRAWLVVGLVTGLAPLLVFKYGAFLLESTLALGAWLGVAPGAERVPALLLPIGISFTTFQALGYVLDVSRGRIRAERDPLELALFVAFFPQLLAGPISRGRELLPQIRAPRSFAEHVAPRALLALFLVGFLKKACIADRIAPLADPFFAAPGEHAALSAWLALALYHVQIYCDFSGYSDMAFACAGLLGYKVPRNFAFPYLARSIGDFWRRWHASFSAWMRDQMYLPLLGRRPSEARRLGMLWLTLVACGAWHGAGWPFVAFGMLHGTFLVVEELVRAGPRRVGPMATRRPARQTRPLAALVGVLVVNALVLVAWPVFRVAELGDLADVASALAGRGGTRALAAPLGLLALFVAGAALVHWAAYACSPRGLGLARELRVPRLAFAAGYGLAWSLVLPFVAAEAAPFLYAGF
jgi:alginate O-acetyltransferase complex protein AlgI